ncbi:glyoxalase/bleomycin resistance/extradiol dioxygenase family protein [Nonomuraea sp. NBC_01738]|uniref:VOC family protein n=1 Tax=Nonomuraea sp. NBC_01738 TaxID=2976003 RepID=UPI002E0DABE2|nr:glyoxalase/bleomycin resistance/extradiol dioxygenase family protein [Nonomuraea sp. NBC_01738]
MDALHPRLLVTDFGPVFRFYDAVLPKLLGAVRTRGAESGPYAHWDVAGQGLLSLFDRETLARAIGADPAVPAGDRVMLVGRVADVDAAFLFCLERHATEAAAPADRPEWGPGLRTAHVRDPEGNLLELQSY